MTQTRFEFEVAGILEDSTEGDRALAILERVVAQRLPDEPSPSSK
jgi:hypothetical protein